MSEEQKIDFLQKQMEEQFSMFEKKEQVQQQELSLCVTTAEDQFIAKSKNSKLVRVTIYPPINTNNNVYPRVFHDIVCVLDVSGSMGSEAKVKNTEGIKESHGLSLLGVLKHAVNTILHNMSENDRFGLVIFSGHARIVFDLLSMTEQNKQNAQNELEKLEASGSTNLSEGLEKSLNLLKDQQLPMPRHQSIFILTDGEPNVSPKEGEVAHLQQYFQKNELQNFKRPTINTFAFGKAMNSKLLDEIAQVGNGQFLYIPCSAFMGTIFVNALSNTLSAMADHMTLKISAINGAKIEQVLGCIPYQKINENEIILTCGELKFGQTRDFMLQMSLHHEKDVPFMNVEMTCFNYMNVFQQDIQKEQHNIAKMTGKFDLKALQQTIKLENVTQSLVEEPLVYTHFSRANMLYKIRNAVKNMTEQLNLDDSQKIIQKLGNQIKKALNYQENLLNVMEQNLDKYDQSQIENCKESIKLLTGYFKDVDGEIRLAFLKKEWFNQWGRHFLPSIMGAHAAQICNNFADPGVQNYGGKLFSQIKEETEKIFLKLPPPKQQFPKQQQQQQAQQGNSGAQSQQQQKARSPSPVDMSAYYNSAGCFSGKGIVNLKNGINKLVRQIVKGDMVQGLDNKFNKVICVVKIKKNQLPFRLVRIGDLIITHKHPIYFNDQWVKPFEVGQFIDENENEVYNFVLKGNKTIIINAICCATFGHGYIQEKIYHKYFGSKRIINDLKKFNGFYLGFIELFANQFKRNTITGQVQEIELQ